MATGDVNRFLPSNDVDTSEFVDGMKNQNTKRKTMSDLRIFNDWLHSEADERCIDEIPSLELNELLAKFFISARTQKKEDYEPDSLKSIQSSISRHIAEKRNINILKDAEFQHSRDVLSAKRKLLKGQGKGNKKQRAEPLSADEIEMLYEKKLLGTCNADALLNTVFLNNGLHFGMRGRQEHTDLLWGDIEMKADNSTGQQYLEFNERLTKTRKGDGNIRAFSPKMFAIPGDPRCPVMVYKEYMKRRPNDTLTPESRFYLSISHKRNINAAVWFTRQPLGKNRLGDLMKIMCEKGEISGRKVNHSARKTAITSLLHSNVEPTTIMQLTGHRNVASLNEYSVASLDQQRKMSNILSTMATGKTSVQNEPSTSFHEIDNDDTQLAMLDIDTVVQTIKQFESHSNNELQQPEARNPVPSVIDLAPSVPPSQFCLMPYAQITGNITININADDRK